MTTTLLFTGNAGPGIAIAAAATALRAAAGGRRTLLLGLGGAQSLGALLGTPLGAEPQTIALGLDALALDGAAEMAALWERSRALLPAQMASIAGDELPIPPGVELLFGPLRLRELAPRYELVVVEAGPHDMLLRALSLPDGMRWAVRLLFGLDRGPGRSPASVARAVAPTSFMPIDTLERIQQARIDAAQTRDLLVAPGTSARYVLRPDRPALDEARLAVPALQLHGLAVPALIAGPLLPELAGASLAGLLDRQRTLLAEAAALWPGRPLLRFELPADEGLSALQAAGQQIFADHDAIVLPAPAPLAEAHDGEPAIVADLAGMPKGALRITLSGDELIVQLGPYRRHILLPERLRGHPIRATREGERMIVRRR
jgi:arsenite/tail-anchored protein-transporting ATPase